MSIFDSNLRRRFASLKSSVSDRSWKRMAPTGKKEGRTLRPSSLKVRHMSRPKFFYLGLPNSILKLAFQTCVDVYNVHMFDKFHLTFNFKSKVSSVKVSNIINECQSTPTFSSKMSPQCHMPSNTRHFHF